MTRDESCKKCGRGWHTVFFTDLPGVTKLGETENTGAVVGSCGRCQRVVNCQIGMIDKRFRKRGLEVGSLF